MLYSLASKSRVNIQYACLPDPMTWSGRTPAAKLTSFWQLGGSCFLRKSVHCALISLAACKKPCWDTLLSIFKMEAIDQSFPLAWTELSQ